MTNTPRPLTSAFSALLLLLLATPLALHAQYRFEDLPGEAGFTATGVNDILQDRQGFLWLATWSGLARYDGYSVKMYRQEPGNSNGLKSNKINCLFEDRQGRLWVGASYTGLYRYDPEGDRFIHYSHDPENPASLSDNNVWAIFEDSRGIFWIGTEKGLNRFDPQSGRFRHFLNDPLDSRSISHNFVYSIQQSPDGTLWIGTEEGLNRLLPAGKDPQSPSQAHFFRYNLTPGNASGQDAKSHNFIYSIHPSRYHDNTLWICTSTGLKKVGFSTADFRKIDFQTFTHENGKSGGLSHSFVSDAWEQDAGHIWVSTYGGLNLLELESGKTLRFQSDRRKPGSLKDNVVRCLFHDRNGNLWAGLDKGLNRLNLRVRAFKNIPFGDDNANNFITCIVPAADEKGLWAGTRGGGLSFIPADAGPQPARPRHFSMAGAAMPDLAGFISSLLLDREGWLWIATDGAGVFRLREKGLSAQGAPPGSYQQYTSSNQLSDNYVMSLLQSARGDIWLGYWDDGLDRYDPATGKFHHYLTTRDLSANLQNFPAVHLFETIEDGQPFLWVGTRGGGVYKLRFDRENNGLVLVRHFQADAGKRGSMSSNFINCFLQDRLGRLWIGTENGLDLLDPEQGTFTWYAEKEGLANPIVQSLLEDRHGDIWASTQQGLSRLRFEQGRALVSNFDYADGLPGSAFSDDAAARAGDALLAFGGTSGLSLFNPDEIAPDTVPPGIRITGLRLFNIPVPIGRLEDGRTILPRNISETGELELSYRDNVISLEFTGLHLGEPGKIRYAYLLEGFNKDWIYTDASQRVAHFTNLPYDEFVFKVKAANGNGAWSEPASLRIKVAPPFWLTGWAYVFYALLLAGLLYGFWRITRLRAEFRHKLELEHLQLEKVEEMSRLKTQFFTNISHELRTPLTLVISPLEQLLQEREGDRRLQRVFHRMHFNANRLLLLINQLLDIRKNEAGLMKLHAQQGDLVAFAREITASLQNLALQRNIRLEFRAAPAEIPAWFDPDQLEKVLFNLLSNAFKYTGDEGRISVSLWQDEELRQVVLEVEDSGIGIPRDQLGRIFESFYQVEDSPEHARKGGSGIGLFLAKTLVEMHHGAIQARSEVGQGTVFRVSLPLGEDHFSEKEKNRAAGRERQEIDEFILPEEAAAAAPGARPEPAPPADPGKPAGKPAILLVEDNPDIRAYLRENLEEDYEVREAADGAAGLASALENPPDLILADIAMPRMDGIELCRRVKSEVLTSHVPFILLTARTSLVFRIDGLETGADDYVTKPFHMRLLKARIRNLLENRRRLRDKFSRSFDLSPTGITLNSLDEQLLKDMKALVEKHLEDDGFTVEQLAQALAMSRMQLYRKLKSLTGKSPDQLIRSIRLQRAAQLLETGRYNVSEVTYMVGYNDLKSFREQFKKEFGVSPSGYEG